MPPYLDKKKLPENLEVWEFEELGSTNSFIKENKHLITQSTLCFTKQQTAGYGRFARNWLASDKDLTFSLAVTFPCALNQLVGLSELVALEIYQILKSYAPDIKVKWPNDLLLNSSKVAGILIEVLATSEQEVKLVIGIGINLSKKERSQEFSANFIDLDDKRELLHSLVNSLMNLAKSYTPQLWEQNIPAWKQADFISLGAQIKIKQQDVEILGKYLGLDKQANLLLESEESKKLLKFVSGEVSLRLRG